MVRLNTLLVVGSITMSLLTGQVVYGENLPLMAAVQEGNHTAIKSILKNKADVNAARADGTTALAWAVYNGDSDAVDLLIASGADVNAANDYGVTPLSLACINSYSVILGKLLNAGAEANLAKQTGETPLMTCTNTGDVAGVKLLLGLGVNINARENKGGQTALMWAVAERHPHVVDVLVNNGADVNLRSKIIQEAEPYIINIKPGESIWGSNYPPTIRFQKISGDFTALHFAAQQGDITSAEILLKAGADINSSHSEHGSPLIIAMASGHEDLARFLLIQGADPNITDAWGIAPLHYALHQGLLFLSGGGQKPTDKVGWTRINMTGLIGDLLDYGADPNVQIKYAFPFQDNYFLARHTQNPSMISPVGATPLLLAGVSGDIDAINQLEEVSDINTKTSGGASLFMLATGAGPEKRALTREHEDKALDAAKLALELGGGSVNDRLTHLAEDGPAKGVADGRTALHFATYRGWTKMVKFLVEQGADINAKDRYGMTPLEIALGDPIGKYYRNIGDGDYDHRYRRPGVTPGTGANETMSELLLSLGATPFSGKYFDAAGY
ncbi:MAG: ankyrin repeat domain-containing protein [Gammaproteobacteria bacterium]|jgi:ankyrin repeat protein